MMNVQYIICVVVFTLFLTGNCVPLSDHEESLRLRFASIFEKEQDETVYDRGIICQLCKDVTFIIQEEISLANESIAVAEKVSQMVCDSLKNKTKKDMCNEIVKDVKEIADMIMDKLDVSKICEKLGFCDSSAVLGGMLLKQPKLSPKPADQCKICTAVVGIISNVLKETNATIEDITNMVKQICSIYPQSKSECFKIVDVVEEIVQNILKGLSPGDICSKFGFCPNSQRMSTVKKQSPCDTCKMVVMIIDDVLHTVNATTADVVKMVNEICGMFPSSSVECAKIADSVEEIIQSLLSGLKPDGICIKLGFCSGTIKMPKLVKSSSRLDSKEACDDCRLVVGVVKKVIKEVNDSLPIVIDAIKAVCNVARLPEEECSEVVSMAKEIIEMVQKEMDVGDICVEIGLCQKDIIHAPRTALRDHSTTKDCPMCRYMVQVVKMGVKMQVPKQAMKRTITYVCGLFKDHQDFVHCTKFSDNLDTVITMLASGKTPEQICEWLGKCTPKELSEVVLHFQKFNSNASCETCKTIVGTIANLVKEFDSNLKDLEDTVDELCSLLGDKESQCKKIAGEVFESIDTVLKMIGEDLDPETICSSIAHVCP